MSDRDLRLEAWKPLHIGAMARRAISCRYTADGTNYDLVVVVDPHGGLIVAWPDMRWAAWASERKNGEIKPYPGVKLSKVDLQNITIALNENAR